MSISYRCSSGENKTEFMAELRKLVQREFGSMPVMPLEQIGDYEKRLLKSREIEKLMVVQTSDNDVLAFMAWPYIPGPSVIKEAKNKIKNVIEKLPERFKQKAGYQDIVLLDFCNRDDVEIIF
jgi:hypothetical protein